MLEFLLSVSLFCRRQKICILTFIFLRSICHYLLALSPGASFDCGTNEIVKKRDNTIGTFVHTNNFIVISIFIGGVVCWIVWDWVCMSAICFSFSRFSNSLVPTHFTHKLYYAYGISFFFFVCCVHFHSVYAFLCCMVFLVCRPANFFAILLMMTDKWCCVPCWWTKRWVRFTLHTRLSFGIFMFDFFCVFRRIFFLWFCFSRFSCILIGLFLHIYSYLELVSVRVY